MPSAADRIAFPGSHLRVAARVPYWSIGSDSNGYDGNSAKEKFAEGASSTDFNDEAGQLLALR